MAHDLLSPVWSATQAPALSERDWESMIGQARSARLLARLAHHYESRGWMTSVPKGPAKHLEAARRFTDRLRYEVLWEAEKIAEALHRVPTPIVLLKGAAYVAAGLPPGIGRLFSDVDIMVPRARLGAVETALFAAGWIAEKLSPYDDRYYREWMHELPPLQHVQRRTSLDVHHTIAPPTSRFATDGAPLIDQAVPVAHVPGLSVLQPVDMVLHSAVHLMQEGDFSGGLRDLLDLNDLLLHFGASGDFWPALLDRAVEIGACVPLHHVLVHIERLFGTRCPEVLAGRVRALGPNRSSQRLMWLLLTHALRPDHPSSHTPFSPIARMLLYLRSHWLRMPWYQIVPHVLRKAWRRAWTRDAPGDTPAGPLPVRQGGLPPDIKR